MAEHDLTDEVTNDESTPIGHNDAAPKSSSLWLTEQTPGLCLAWPDPSKLTSQY